MAEFVGPALEVGKCIGGPIKRQFNYLFCFNNNIQNLRDEAKKLKDTKDGVEGQVDVARRNVQVILPQVETWLGEINKIQANMSAIEPEIENAESSCLAIKARFSLSRRATKMAVDMKELLEDHANFGQICHSALPAAIAPIPLGHTYELESRKHLEEDIMATLREKKKGSMMGICGMGGLGKTVMAKKIMSRAREEGLFDEIVMAVVSQPIDISRIQREMAEFLGLKLEVEGVLARAHLLRARLSNAKSILIILDDLWERLDLEDLGIPDQRELKECTILLTSRSRDVFDAMNVEKTFQMKILEDEEAWSLFIEKVGACANDQSLFPLAQEIVRECKGLPIALVCVGVALKNKTLKFVWESAVHDLRSGNPKDIPKFLAQVYNPLKLSYDLLESEHAGLIFLMCCLFPEDRNIRISDLGFYAWGLGMFEGIGSLQDAWNKVQTLVQMLKTRSLLLDGDEDGFTKMHDIVRDVGIFIAAKKGLIDPNVSCKSNYSIDCTWISLFKADKITLPGGPVSPNIRFFLIEESYMMLEAKEGLPLGDNFFERAKKLNVLSIKGYIFRDLPHTIQLQKNLRTLILEICESLVDISVVGELVSLEILYIYGCDSIEELPIEIGRLSQLKLLHIEYCQNLKTIAAGVISKLVRLEELTLMSSFSKWERGASEGKNAALCELNSLSNLTTLRIKIEDASLAAEEIHLSSNLVEFQVQIGIPHYITRSHGREMNLRLEGEVIGNWIHQLLRKTECLGIQGEGSGKLVPLLPEFQSLKQLELQNLKMTRLIDVRSSSTAAILPLLEVLCLVDIDNLEKINLGNDCLLRLKRLSIRACSMLEQVVMWNEEENIQSITFPKLESLFLDDLPRLTSFCRGIQNIEFPLLTEMEIEKCPNMKSLVSSGAMKHDDDSLHIFCKSKAVFGRLKELRIKGISSVISKLWCDQISMDIFTGLVDLTISNCGNIKSLFSPTVASNLVNLERIEIKSCSMLEQVVLWNEEENEQSSCNHSSVTFPKLERLDINDLPRLTSFCKGIQSIEFPLLTRMNIVECPNLKSLVSSTENDFKKCMNDDSLHLFCKPDKTAVGRLVRLEIGGYDCIKSIWCDQIPIDFFTRLEVLEVFNCGNIKNLFSPSIAGNLVNLRKLSIKSCREMVKVLEDRVDEIGGSPFIKLKVLRNGEDINGQSSRNHLRITLPKLETLELDDLPRLKYFSNGKRCSGAIDVDDSLHLFCKSQVALVRLKELQVGGYDCSERSVSLWCDQIPIDFFTGLEVLKVSNCDNIKSMFSASIAGNLVHLRELTIYSCGEMVKVIEDEEALESSPIFTKLEKLWLIKLPKLKTFCDWRCALHLPSLTKVFIRECPEIERFSFGSLTTPNLNKISIDDEHNISDYTEDLNDAIKLY